MITSVSMLSIIAYLVALIKLNKKYIEQQVVFAIIYLTGLTIIGEMDILLPIYFIVSLLPFFRYIRKIRVCTAIISVYFGLYVLYGIINQNINETFVTFIAKIWQFIIFFIVYDSDIKLKKEPIKRIIWLAVIVETLLGFYLLATSTNIDANGLARLVSNSQPITGNISTIVLPISVYFYLKNRGNSKQTIWFFAVNIVMLIWIILSGTRGYTLEFVATMMLIFYDYFTNGQVGEISRRNRLMIVILITILTFVIVISVPIILEKFESALRLKADVGIRTFENAAVIEFIKNASVFTMLFGIGLGGKAGSYPEMRVALYEQFSKGMWKPEHYLIDNGALFHNLYGNILLCLGIVGVFVFMCLIISIWKHITYSCNGNSLLRKTMHLFLISFLLMNYYRWSADCGISEMIIFALVMKLIKQENNIRSNDRNCMFSNSMEGVKW